MAYKWGRTLEAVKTIGSILVSESKQDAGISSAGVPRKLRGWKAIQNACPRVACKWEVSSRGMHGGQESYITREHFDKGRTKQKGKKAS